MKKLESLEFSNSFISLGEDFFSPVKPTPLENSYLISFSRHVAELLDIDVQQFKRPDIAQIFSGEKLLPGSEPFSMLYAGHQFGQYVPQLGDGRAIVLGEIKNSNGELWELQLKGAGLTPYSRDGDGRAVLRSTVREYLCSEAMAGLGIPTTRALCMTGSDEEVYREQIETGAMLLRVAPSHVRFGSFEVFFYRQQYAQLRLLADYVIRYHFPELVGAEGITPQSYLELLRLVIRRTASLMAQWQLVGFSHGVMNTDNMSILGLTLDYGPFGFLDNYDPGFICNHSDYQGRYAFERQPNIGLWNLTCLAQAMLPLLDEDSGEHAAEIANAALQEYEPQLVKQYAAGMRKKLGFRQATGQDQTLSASLLELMHSNRVDYSSAFRKLSQLQISATGNEAAFRDLFVDRPAIDSWLADYRTRLVLESSQDRQRQLMMNDVNPKYILRNYLAQQAIEKAEKGDFSEIEKLMTVLTEPYAEHENCADYALPPAPDMQAVAVSCSS